MVVNGFWINTHELNKKVFSGWYFTEMTQYTGEIWQWVVIGMVKWFAESAISCIIFIFWTTAVVQIWRQHRNFQVVGLLTDVVYFLSGIMHSLALAQWHYVHKADAGRCKSVSCVDIINSSAYVHFSSVFAAGVFPAEVSEVDDISHVRRIRSLWCVICNYNQNNV